MENNSKDFSKHEKIAREHASKEIQHLINNISNINNSVKNSIEPLIFFKKEVLKQLKKIRESIKPYENIISFYNRNPNLSKEIEKKDWELYLNTVINFLDEISDPTDKDFLKLHETLKELPNEEEEKTISDLNNYYLTRQTPQTNNLNKIKARLTDNAQLDIYGNGIITEKDFTLYIENLKELIKIDSTAKILLDILIIKNTEQGNNDLLVKLSLNEYMEYRGLNDIKNAREQVNRDLRALNSIKFSFKGTGKKKGDYITIGLGANKYGIKDGIISFEFRPEFYNHIKNAYLMALPKEALTFNPKLNPHSYYILRYLSEMKRINITKKADIIVSIKSLLKACPELPTYDEVMATDKHLSKRIMNPIERDLDALKQINWEYINEQPNTYEEFINSKFKAIFIEYPDQEKLLKSREKYVKKRQAKQQKN
jgi:hypothetical protein